MGKMFEIRNLTLSAANEFVTNHHRHNKKVQGHKFSIGALYEEELIGVAIIGRPVARKLDDGLTAEVTRLCVIENSPKNACSFLYRAAWRAWSAMGGQRMITYTLESESGSSLKGAAFNIVGISPKWKDGKGWTTRPGREWQQVHSEKKIRWEIGDSINEAARGES